MRIRRRGRSAPTVPATFSPEPPTPARPPVRSRVVDLVRAPATALHLPAVPAAQPEPPRRRRSWRESHPTATRSAAGRPIPLNRWQRHDHHGDIQRQHERRRAPPAPASTAVATTSPGLQPSICIAHPWRRPHRLTDLRTACSTSARLGAASASTRRGRPPVRLRPDTGRSHR
jgi:hypothetical protein